MWSLNVTITYNLLWVDTWCRNTGSQGEFCVNAPDSPIREPQNKQQKRKEKNCCSVKITAGRVDGHLGVELDWWIFMCKIKNTFWPPFSRIWVIKWQNNITLFYNEVKSTKDITRKDDVLYVQEVVTHFI